MLGYGDPREWLEAGGNEGGPLFGCGQHRSDRRALILAGSTVDVAGSKTAPPADPLQMKPASRHILIFLTRRWRDGVSFRPIDGSESIAGSVS